MVLFLYQQLTLELVRRTSSIIYRANNTQNNFLLFRKERQIFQVVQLSIRRRLFNISGTLIALLCKIKQPANALKKKILIKKKFISLSIYLVITRITRHKDSQPVLIQMIMLKILKAKQGNMLVSEFLCPCKTSQKFNLMFLFDFIGPGSWGWEFQWKL